MTNKKGKFIVVEGGDYSGKSTFIDTLKRTPFLDISNAKFTREPGNKLIIDDGSNVCEEIRNLLLSNDMPVIDDQALLFAASRAIHTNNIIELINKGYNVICDRYVLSSFAYQAYAGDMGYFNVFQLNKNALRELYKNDIDINILLFTVSDETYFARKLLRSLETDLDVIEKKDQTYFDKVNEFYNKGIYKDYLPIEAVDINIYNIDANKTIQEVHAQGLNHIRQILKLG